MLVDEVMIVQKKIKALMFKYIQQGVGARGVSVLATKTIIDSIKVIETLVSCSFVQSSNCRPSGSL